MYIDIVHVTTVMSLENLPMSSVQAPLELAKSKDRVKGEYIVVFDDNITDEQGGLD